MGRRKVAYYQVLCDYPAHGLYRDLPKGAGYRFFNSGKYVVCEDCWVDKLVVEDLLKILHIDMTQSKVGQEYFDVGG